MSQNEQGGERERREKEGRRGEKNPSRKCQGWGPVEVKAGKWRKFG